MNNQSKSEEFRQTLKVGVGKITHSAFVPRYGEYEDPLVYRSGGFYSNIKDRYPWSKGKTEHKILWEDEPEKFVYVYNPETGRHEGKWLSEKERENVII